jgi:glycosyltransferase involved in cell wall biosynthesis
LGLKILHLSDSSLPDWRIEKAALSSKKAGHDVYFAGRPSSPSNRSVFEKIYLIEWNSRSRNKFPLYWHSLKKQMRRVFREVNPDIIHAHNVFSAKMAKEIGGYPMVYDNHEYWSVYLKRQLESINSNSLVTVDEKPSTKSKRLENKIRTRLKSRYVNLWSRQEELIVSTTPTITVSNTIVEDLKKIGSKVYLVPNYPIFDEVNWIRAPIYHEDLSSVYAGVEPTGNTRSIHRNIDGFIDLFDKYSIGKLAVLGWKNTSTQNVDFLGYLGRREMYEQMQKHSVGIIPFKPHWSHIFISPNKAYEYAHAGLFVITSSSFVPIMETLRENCLAFKDYLDLKEKILELSNDVDSMFKRRLQIYQFARENLLWEKYESNIFEAYKNA